MKPVTSHESNSPEKQETKIRGKKNSPRNSLVNKETLVNLWSAIPFNVIIACSTFRQRREVREKFILGSAKIRRSHGFEHEGSTLACHDWGLGSSAKNVKTIASK